MTSRDDFEHKTTFFAATKHRPHHIMGDYKLKTGFTAQSWSIVAAVDGAKSLL